MRVLVLHTDVVAGAAADELDTLVTAKVVAETLEAHGHEVTSAAFEPEPLALSNLLSRTRAEIVFNLVESVYGDGFLACVAAAMLEKSGIPYTGAGAACLALSADKVLSKHVLRAVCLPTSDWAEPPLWQGLAPHELYVVKSVTEDASLGLDDGAVVTGERVRDRACASKDTHGGRWFAESYLDGAEFNVALLEDGSRIRVLPIAEMRFEEWEKHRPRIVGYAAKWDDSSDDARKTVRRFGVERGNTALAGAMVEAARKAWSVFRLRGYARIDFRCDASGSPMILEVNPNPCLEPQAGFAAAAVQTGISYGELLDRILSAGLRS